MNPHVKEIYRATHVPTSNTHNGVLVLETRDAGRSLETAFFDAVDP